MKPFYLYSSFSSHDESHTMQCQIYVYVIDRQITILTLTKTWS